MLGVLTDTAPDVACVCVCAYARLPHRDLKHDSPIVVEGVVGVVLLMTPPLHDCRLTQTQTENLCTTYKEDALSNMSLRLFAGQFLLVIHFENPQN